MDLNADMGESFGRWTLGDDEALLDVVTSANVACGFHAGDPLTLLRTCELAARAGVVIGAQVGYRDLAGFGRRFIDVAPDDLRADVLYQLGALHGLARAAGTRVLYLKPHGALYHAVTTSQAQARAVVDAVLAFDQGLSILGAPGSHLLRLAGDAGLRTVREAFADRAYTPDGRLVDRREPGAVLHDPEAIAAQAVRLATEGTVGTIDGRSVDVDAQSICLHGDTPGAVASARAVRAALQEKGITPVAFTGGRD
ncbi:LamB/YcsF family protein [Tsukamurella sp. 1534]|uniref:LamB/YcsF family protein n=1 Tax=Tsukamurella sp. 1534 TaxID=1151061 RepID=UPI0002E131C1|nr:5-oxoprolinase subunit PxpA [Tsukamurella sp. 1534]